MKNSGIDIIIPVYNALEDLKKCIQSLLRHTDLTANRIVLIDDQSPDPAVYPYLQSITQPGIEVLQNEKNLGFSGTVNRGLQHSRRDVVLLNTDTVVTSRWLEKMTACAESDPAIGTVTPFSNNATLCSIPDFCRENTVPYGLSIDAYADIIEACSLRKYPRITVAVGFCMLIKQEVVDRVGLFDQETFQRGYGEENDFCWRAEQLGYHHVLCDDTYIYHSGSSSFVSDEKKKLMEDHQRILQDRYPLQIQRNAEYVQQNPHQYLRDNVDIYAKLANGRKNILYVLHSDFREDASDHIGGTQFHVKDLVTHGRGAHNVFVLARDGQILRLTIYLEQEQISFAFRAQRESDFQSFRSEPIAQILRQVLQGFSIDLVHVHHVHGISFDIFYVARELGIPVMLTMHDFYYVCPTVKLLENGTAYCHGHGGNCTGCLHHELGFAAQVDYLPLWQAQCREAMGLCQMLIVPSESARSVYAVIYPELADRIRVIPHGMDAFHVAEDSQPQEKKRRRIAFLGGLNVAKGSQIACRMIRQGGNQYDWYIIGGIGDGELQDLDKRNIHKTDWYQREEVGTILRENRIDLVCILPIWPETFCYTLSEAQLAGVPTLVSDIGALGDRMRQDGTGWIVPANATAKEILEKIAGIFADEAGYQKVCDTLASFRHKTIAEMYGDYAQLYQETVPAAQREVSYDPAVIYNAWALCQAEKTGYGIDGDVELIHRIQELENTLNSIEGSMSYRFFRKLQGRKIPFKRQLKALAGAMYRLYRKMKGKK